MSKTLLTKEGMENLRKEIHSLRQIDVKECIEAISDARDKGDLSENSEYDVAKERYDNLNLKINKLNEILSNAVVINEELITTDAVQILTTVSLKNTDTGKDFDYTIVPHIETNVKEGRISVNSPVAQALIGKSKGDNVKVITPSGEIKLEIVDIKF